MTKTDNVLVGITKHAITIRIDGLIHAHFMRENIISFTAWIDDERGSNRYYIAFQQDNGGEVKLDYMLRAYWETILLQLEPIAQGIADAGRTPPR